MEQAGLGHEAVVRSNRRLRGPPPQRAGAEWKIIRGDIPRPGRGRGFSGLDCGTAASLPSVSIAGKSSFGAGDGPLTCSRRATHGP